MPSSIELILPFLGDGDDKSCPLKNCLRNNTRHLRKWAKRTQTSCFRLYDRDIKEYPLAIDYYGGRFCVHHFAYLDEEEDLLEERMQKVNGILKELFKAEEKQIHWRVRRRREKTQQYEKLSSAREFFPVLEYGIPFLVNLRDYLDTGLFLDHREARKLVASFAKGKRLLNLFAYTCSFTVHAALAGALYSKSVDMSNTYTEWGRQNLELNSLSLRAHEIIRADCLKFLKEEIQSKNRYDLIVIDPPTLSRSKKMDSFFDIQINYVSLIEDALKLLSPGGMIFFSTNSKKFLFEEAHFKDRCVTELTDKTHSIDFRKKTRALWKIF